MLVCFEKNESCSLLAVLNEAYDSILFGLKTRIVELSFVLEPHHQERTHITGEYLQSQTCLRNLPFLLLGIPAGALLLIFQHLNVIFKNRCHFSKAVQSEASLFLKYQSLRLSFSLSMQKLSYKFLIIFFHLFFVGLSENQVSAGTKYRGGKLGCIIGLAKMKGIFVCNSAKL